MKPVRVQSAPEVQSKALFGAAGVGNLHQLRQLQLFTALSLVDHLSNRVIVKPPGGASSLHTLAP